ncbi:hypothetical protein QYM36_015987 [Artemia franciscana]|uniref:MULE transposase domain-containing protein n=1 Tax=Artemia franciscana TaxID=6661 RepID=A0AA88H659_ARTSF|nr:hypothetical protein QYM36_015987 [Artemia franciscana]
MAKLLERSELMLSDGTFKCVPRVFFQLYTMHGKAADVCPPCLYFLLTNKTEETFKRMVEYFKQVAPLTNPNLKKDCETDVHFNMLGKSLCAVAFVPTDDIVNIFELLCGQFSDRDDCTEILPYFDGTYIRGVQIHGRRIRPRFPPELWNGTEGFHHALKVMFSCYHTGVWKLFEGIKSDINIQRLMATQAGNGIEGIRGKYNC